MQGNNEANLTPNRNMLAEKELLYVKDYLSWELLAMKKCHEAASSCQDPQLKQVIQHVGKKHQQHYDTLLAQLQ